MRYNDEITAAVHHQEKKEAKERNGTLKEKRKVSQHHIHLFIFLQLGTDIWNYT